MKRCVFSTSISETSENVVFFFMISFPWSLYSHTIFFFGVVRNKTPNTKYQNQNKVKSSRKEYVMRTCFKFWPMKNIFQKLWANESLIMPCLQI